MKQSYTTNRKLHTLIIIVLLSVICGSVAHSSDIPPANSVLLFPFIMESGFPSAKTEMLNQADQDLFVLISGGMSEKRRFAVVEFSPQLPSMRRAVHEQVITDKELAKPVDTTVDGAEKAQKLARYAGTSYVMSGSIDSYEYAEKEGETALTVTAQMIDVSDGKMSTFTATGRGKRVDGKPDQTEESILISATYDAAQKILANAATIGSPDSVNTPEAVKENTKPQKKSNKRLFPMVLGAIALGFLVSSR